MARAERGFRSHSRDQAAPPRRAAAPAPEPIAIAPADALTKGEADALQELQGLDEPAAEGGDGDGSEAGSAQTEEEASEDSEEEEEEEGGDDDGMGISLDEMNFIAKRRGTGRRNSVSAESSRSLTLSITQLAQKIPKTALPAPPSLPTYLPRSAAQPRTVLGSVCSSGRAPSGEPTLLRSGCWSRE